jgi:Protein of unknown function (DUF3306)
MEDERQMTQENEAFLDRWSRLKRERPAQVADKPAVPETKAEPAPPPPLPPVEQLKPESDFTPFMNPKVDAQTRRSALKKLFADAHYNIPDPFEAYSEDYTQSETIPEKMLKAINRVRDVAVKGEEQVAEEERVAEAVRTEAGNNETAAAGAPAQEPDDVAGKQDA